MTSFNLRQIQRLRPLVIVVLIKTDDRGFGLASFVFPCRIKGGYTARVVDSVEEAYLSQLLSMWLVGMYDPEGNFLPFLYDIKS